MKTILILITTTLLLIPALAQAKVDPTPTGVVDSDSLILSVTGSSTIRVKTSLVVEKGLVLSLTKPTTVCNRKNPPDCRYRFGYRETHRNPEGTEFVGSRVARQIKKHYQSGKRFRVRVVTAIEDGTMVTRYRCRKQKKSDATSCRFLDRFYNQEVS